MTIDPELLRVGLGMDHPTVAGQGCLFDLPPITAATAPGHLVAAGGWCAQSTALFNIDAPMTDAEAAEFWRKRHQQATKRANKAERKLRKLRKLLVSK